MKTEALLQVRNRNCNFKDKQKLRPIAENLVRHISVAPSERKEVG